MSSPSNSETSHRGQTLRMTASEKDEILKDPYLKQWLESQQRDMSFSQHQVKPNHKARSNHGVKFKHKR